MFAFITLLIFVAAMVLIDFVWFGMELGIVNDFVFGALGAIVFVLILGLLQVGVKF